MAASGSATISIMSSVTDLLARWSDGDPQALTELIPLVYHELRLIARYHIGHEGPGCTLQATALVHEAYLRLVDQNRMQWKGRDHFIGAAAQAMRRVLVDQARERNAQKRGGGAIPEPLDMSVTVAIDPTLNVLDLNRALEELESLDPERARVVELRYFGGLSLEGCGTVLGVSTAAVYRDWTVARAWLYRRLTGPDDAATT